MRLALGGLTYMDVTLNNLFNLIHVSLLGWFLSLNFVFHSCDSFEEYCILKNTGIL